MPAGSGPGGLDGWQSETKCGLRVFGQSETTCGLRVAVEPPVYKKKKEEMSLVFFKCLFLWVFH